MGLCHGNLLKSQLGNYSFVITYLHKRKAVISTNESKYPRASFNMLADRKLFL